MKLLIPILFLSLLSCSYYRERREQKQIDELLLEQYNSSQEIRAAHPELEEAFRVFSQTNEN